MTYVPDTRARDWSVTAIAVAGTTATASVADTATLMSGQSVTIAGATPAALNGAKTITVTGSTSFTFAVAAETAAGSGTIVYRWSSPWISRWSQTPIAEDGSGPR